LSKHKKEFIKWRVKQVDKSFIVTSPELSPVVTTPTHYIRDDISHVSETLVHNQSTSPYLTSPPMANYDCDPFPHVPAGMVAIPPGPLRTQRGYVVLGGEFPVFADDWAVATLTPGLSQNHFEIIRGTIENHLQGLGLEVRSMSKCAMGSALVRFATVTDRDAPINLSPHYLGDTVLRFVAQDNGINRRATLLTHDVWVMLVNYPAECWDLDCIVKTFVPYGRFLVWNKDLSDHARVLVKIRAYNVDTLPMSIVVMRNLTEDGNTDSWTCPLILLQRRMFGGVAGDEDPLPPDGANPHPLP
jgi:hypothetical protein